MNYLFIANTPLFRGIQPSEIEQLLTCLNNRKKQYKKNEIIFCAGSPVHEIGLVLSGSVNIVVNFYWGTSHRKRRYICRKLCCYTRQRATL